MKRPKTRLRYLQAALAGARDVLILPHNYPDPDAIAASVALKFLLAESFGLKVRIGYRGTIGRAENRALVRYLDSPLERITLTELREATHVALVDTQPGAGNHSLPDDVTPAIVIDHHPLLETTQEPPFVDIRPEVGASSTMLVEYLEAAALTIDSTLATALFYGIQTDTLGLQRSTTPLDREVFCSLLPQVDIEAIARIERAQVSPDYFRSVAETLHSACVYGGVIIAYMSELSYPDLAADMADFLLRMRGCRWVICMGIYKDTLFISVRTENKRGAGQLVRTVVGTRGSAGGHGSMAGGQIHLAEGDSAETLAAQLRTEFLQELSVAADVQGESLI